MTEIFKTNDFSIVECDEYYLIIPFKRTIKVIFKESICSNEMHAHKLIIDKSPINCSQCYNHNYDWDIDDGYGGYEYEVCDKGHELYPMECNDFKEL